MKKIICHLLLALPLTTSFAQNLWSGLIPGPYAVGFRSGFEYDYSRTFKEKYDSIGSVKSNNEDRFRPIQISIWYPCLKPEKKTMYYEEYYYLVANEQREVKLNDSIKAATLSEIVSWGINKSKIENNLKKRSLAYKKGEPVNKKFPLIVYATSFSAPSFENNILCEYLASYGYVVISSPSMGQNTRDMTGDMSGIESQVQDLQFLVNYAAQKSYVDIDNMGVAGFSWGGLTDVFLQMKNNKIKAVVSYDGSIANNNGLDHFNNCTYCDYSKMDVPFMYMSQKGRKENLFYNKLNYSDAYYLSFHKNQHTDFASMFIDLVNNYSDSTKELTAKRSYEIQCLYTLNFFNSYLRNDSVSQAFLSKSTLEHGIADTILTMVSKKAQPIQPSQEYFLKVLDRDGITKAKELYQEVKKRDPDYKLFKETSINSRGYAKLRSDKIDEAIVYFNFNVEAFPNSANVYDSLADAYIKKGEKEKAIDALKKCLQLNASHGNGSAALKLAKLTEVK